MRMLRKNQQSMYYALQIAEIPEFETIYYTDNDGNQYPIDIKPTGKTEIVYGEPVPFMASISMSGGEAEAVEYGLSTDSYSAVLITDKNSAPLKEGTLIWHTSEPQFKHIDANAEIDDTPMVFSGDYPIRESSDYYVVSIRDSLNFTKVILQAINK